MREYADRLAKRKEIRKIKKALLIVIASFFYAIGISLFLDPNNLVPGGITGISILLNRFTQIETGTLILVLNIPILIIAWIKFGFRFVLSTFATLAVISFLTNYFSRFLPLTRDPILAAVIGGSITAVGLGMILRTGVTTGGTDIVVKLLRLKFRHMKTGFLFLMIDFAVVLLSVPVFGNIEMAMYASIALLVMSQVMDFVLYGRDEAKLIYVISDHTEQIATLFLNEMDIGVTYLKGIGAYTHTSKQIIMCVMRKRNAPRAEEIVKDTDPTAFMIVTSASEIYGEGYKSYDGKIV